MAQKPKRYQTTITIKPLETPDFESLLQLLYRGSKNPDLPDHAHRFLKELRSAGETGRFERAKWQEYCTVHEISKTTYYTMINKLLGVGLIEVIERDYYKLSNRSERFFDALILSIRAFMSKKIKN
ncbi:MAG: hypothetical protein KAS12_00075 [Candidatus Aenigmarchaeota archaeon]|nr:hypothetical protein [Candidatus Aenigmarchaeota archaeon]